MYVLGISCYYHDASAALIKDGVVVAAAQEERFTRKKHDSSFPKHAIEFCLESQGITIKDVAHIGFYEKPLLKFERVLSQHLQMFPWSLKTFLSSTPSWITEKLRVLRAVRKKLKYKKDVYFVEHHMAHAATFLSSPFQEAAIVTIDGVGEWTTTSYGYGKDTTITLEKEITFPHSLGLLYSAVTAYLGFSVNNSEYKVMGLSPYGNMNPKTNPYYTKLRKTLDLKPDGSYRLDMQYFVYHYKDRMPSRAFCKLMGGPIRKPHEPLTKRHKDIAAAVQLVYEEALFTILHHVQKQTGSTNLVLAGGCGLNSVANGKIIKNTSFTNFWTQPDPGDGGTSIGAAAYVYHTILKRKRVAPVTNPYLGPAYTEKEIKTYLDKNNITYERFANDDELVNTTAQLIKKNHVIGWFQLGMEWGPRALGARSILSNACNPRMQEILNLKVKHREKFRPFAPAVCADDALTYFDCDTPAQSPADYMLLVYPIKKEWRKKIPAVTHVDGSGRLQTVRREQNPLYYDVIKAFGKQTGIPILINTSFNIRGEPIVCTPHDAYRCMMGTEIDYLVLGNFLIRRNDNPQDKWDSESIATD